MDVNDELHYARLAAEKQQEQIDVLREVRNEINTPELRDRIAMAAMQGMLASCCGPAWGINMFPLAESAYKYADLMMEARKQ